MGDTPTSEAASGQKADTKASPPPQGADDAARMAAAQPIEDKKPDASTLAELEAQTKRAAFEGMRRAKEFKRQREELEKRAKEIAEREEKVKEAESWESNFLRDPIRFIQKRLGAEWYDKLSQAKLSGAVTPDMVAVDVDERMAAVQRDMQAKLDALQKQLQEKESQAAGAARAEYEASARAYVKSNADKYPLIHAFEVTDNIAAVIRHHFDQTTKLGEDGEMVAGEVLTPQQAADLMEKHLEARVASVEKAKAAKSQPNAAASDRRSEIPQRRSLSTDIGGSSRADRPPPVTEAERMRRALAAIDALGKQPN